MKENNKKATKVASENKATKDINLSSGNLQAVATASAAPAKPRQSSNEQSALAGVPYEDIKVTELRQKIASRWASPRFEDSPEYAALYAAVASLDADIKERAINGARLAWLARPENAAICPSVSAVVDVINAEYASEFESVCGGTCPAASAVRVWSYSALSVTTIQADSNKQDYLLNSALPAGASASAVVAGIMSVRFRYDVEKRINLARAAARASLSSALAGCVRSAVRLGLSYEVVANELQSLWATIPANDSKDLDRLIRNRDNLYNKLRALDADIVSLVAVGGGIEQKAKYNKRVNVRAVVSSSIDRLDAIIATA